MFGLTLLKVAVAAQLVLSPAETHLPVERTGYEHLSACASLMTARELPLLTGPWEVDNLAIERLRIIHDNRESRERTEPCNVFVPAADRDRHAWVALVPAEPEDPDHPWMESPVMLGP